MMTEKAPRDIWADAQPAESNGIVADDMRDLWTRTWPGLGDDEHRVVALALSDAKTAKAEAAREALTASYMSIARSIVRFHMNRDSEDVRQTALLGMWQGFREYDPARHTRPLATVQLNIRRALSARAGARFHLSINEHDRLAYSRANAAHPEDIEAAAAAAPEHGLPTPAFWSVYYSMHTQSVAPDGTLAVDREDAVSQTLTPLVEAPEPASPATVALVEALLARLDETERRVIALRFGLDGEPAHTKEEAARVLGRSVRRVLQIQAAALDKMRESTPEA